MNLLETPLFKLTLGEFLEAIELNTINLKSNFPNETEMRVEKKELVYGLAGLAKLIGSSKNHASRLKTQGVFDGAIKQNGRLIVIDKDLALELFDKYKSR